MEIITVMVEGALNHRDSMGHSATVQAGEVQRMSAGTGIVHSEINRGESASSELVVRDLRLAAFLFNGAPRPRHGAGNPDSCRDDSANHYGNC